MKKPNRNTMLEVLKTAGYDDNLLEILSDKQLLEEAAILNRKSNRLVASARRKNRNRTLDNQASALKMARSGFQTVKAKVTAAMDNIKADVDADALKRRVDFLASK